MIKRRIIAIIIFCCIIVFGIVAVVYNRYWKVDGKIRIQAVGSFEYEYKVQREGTWITKITPKSEEDISVLKIPSRLGGRSVVKLGSEGDKFRFDDENSPKMYENLFGEVYSEDSTRDHTIITPENIYEMVGKIKEIQVPESVRWISLDAFEYVQDGKIINIPQKIETELKDTSWTRVKWKKVSLSTNNKKYKVANGCLCSKDGKILYGIIEAHKTIAIPEGVETISWKGDYSGAEVIKIPASVIKIGKWASAYGLATINPVTIQISEANKKFAVKDGSVYDKTSGELISGNIKDGVLKIPDTVKIVDDPRFLGNIETLKKVIVPASVTTILNFERDSNFGHFDLELVFEGEKPPGVYDQYLFYRSKIYVPKGCEEAYRKRWGTTLTDNGSDYVLEEME